MLVVMAIAFQDAYNLMLALYPWLNIAPSNGAFFLIFGLFRFFDIKKPFFIKKLDRMSKSSIFVILDDIFAALFASGVIKIAFLIIDRIL